MSKIRMSETNLEAQKHLVEMAKEFLRQPVLAPDAAPAGSTNDTPAPSFDGTPAEQTEETSMKNEPDGPADVEEKPAEDEQTQLGLGPTREPSHPLADPIKPVFDDMPLEVDSDDPAPVRPSAVETNRADDRKAVVPPKAKDEVAAQIAVAPSPKDDDTKPLGSMDGMPIIPEPPPTPEIRVIKSDSFQPGNDPGTGEAAAPHGGAVEPQGGQGPEQPQPANDLDGSRFVPVAEAAETGPIQDFNTMKSHGFGPKQARFRLPGGAYGLPTGLQWEFLVHLNLIVPNASRCEREFLLKQRRVVVNELISRGEILDYPNPIKPHRWRFQIPLDLENFVHALPELIMDEPDEDRRRTLVLSEDPIKRILETAGVLGKRASEEQQRHTSGGEPSVEAGGNDLVGADPPAEPVPSGAEGLKAGPIHEHAAARPVGEQPLGGSPQGQVVIQPPDQAPQAGAAPPPTDQAAAPPVRQPDAVVAHGKVVLPPKSAKAPAKDGKGGHGRTNRNLTIVLTGILTVIVTVLGAGGLFFGSRALLRILQSDSASALPAKPRRNVVKTFDMKECRTVKRVRDGTATQSSSSALVPFYDCSDGKGTTRRVSDTDDWELCGCAQLE